MRVIIIYNGIVRLCMGSPNLTEAVVAMRSYHAAINASPANPNLVSLWIQRQTNADIAPDFSHNAAIALLHYYQHPLYGNSGNLPPAAQGWLPLMQPAENILSNEETWIDTQIMANINTTLTRIFTTDNMWLQQWAAINNFPADTPLAYIVNSLISRLINCEGANGPSGAGGISFTEHTLPSGGGSLP